MSTVDSYKYCIAFEDVDAAAVRIEGVAHRTPVLTSQCLDRKSGRNLYFKVEALQKTGSFKFRGALNAVKSIIEETPGTKDVQVVTHSSGNHAQALALAAREASKDGVSIRATIVMPYSTPSVKKAAVEGYGGIPVMTESTNEARERECDRILKETKAIFVHPSEDPRVIAGQGTACLEMIQQIKELGVSALDAVIIPVGGGGLAAGNTISLRAVLGRNVKIILAEPEVLDDAKRSFESKTLLKHEPNNPLNSVADGLKTTLGPNTWPIIRDLVDDVITVSEEEILRATKLVWERLKICIEPSAGVGVAVAFSQAFQEKFSKQQRVGIILCGGNVDVVKITTRMQEMGV